MKMQKNVLFHSPCDNALLLSLATLVNVPDAIRGTSLIELVWVSPSQHIDKAKSLTLQTYSLDTPVAAAVRVLLSTWT
jgi:hypothetical protein